MRLLAGSLFLWAFCAAAASPPRRLIAIGGGRIPPSIYAKFAEWSGGKSARIVVLPWATAYPEDSCHWQTAGLKEFEPKEVICSPKMELVAEQKELVLTHIRGATGIFFSGGDQNRVMDVLKDASLLEALKSAYQKGTVMAGTSAGTAIMSPIMLTGFGDFSVINPDAVETRPGIGFMPDVIFDQHFLKRKRLNRLISVLKAFPGHLGIGVDEETAFAVENESQVHVVGDSQVAIVKALKGDEFNLSLLSAGSVKGLTLKRTARGLHSQSFPGQRKLGR